jgi:hypothetical protein
LADEKELFFTINSPFGGFGGLYAFISTSTPEGKSNLLKASTVREDEV